MSWLRVFGDLGMTKNNKVYNVHLKNIYLYFCFNFLSIVWIVFSFWEEICDKDAQSNTNHQTKLIKHNCEQTKNLLKMTNRTATKQVPNKQTECVSTLRTTSFTDFCFSRHVIFLDPNFLKLATFEAKDKNINRFGFS